MRVKTTKDEDKSRTYTPRDRILRPWALAASEARQTRQRLGQRRRPPFMDLFLRTSRCRIPRQLLSYQYSRRCYATALASSSSTARPPLPTAHRAVPEQTRLPQKKVPPSTTSSSPASSSSDKHAQLKGSAVAFTTAKKIRKARVQQMETEQIQQTNAQMLQAVQELSAIEHLATFDVWAKPVENLGAHGPPFNRDSNAYPRINFRLVHPSMERFAQGCGHSGSLASDVEYSKESCQECDQVRHILGPKL